MSGTAHSRRPNEDGTVVIDRGRMQFRAPADAAVMA